MYVHDARIAVPVIPSGIALPVLGFAIPFLFPGPQLVTGTAVNAVLVWYAVSQKKPSAYMAVLPGLGAVLRGAVFGPMTHHVAAFLPAIWLGNWIYMSAVCAGTHTTSVRVLLGACGKAVVIAAYAAGAARFMSLPDSIVWAMGPVQLLTAISGGISAFILLRVCRKRI